MWQVLSGRLAGELNKDFSWGLDFSKLLIEGYKQKQKQKQKKNLQKPVSWVYGLNSFELFSY